MIQQNPLFIHIKPMVFEHDGIQNIAGAETPVLYAHRTTQLKHTPNRNALTAAISFIEIIRQSSNCL